MSGDKRANTHGETIGENAAAKTRKRPGAANERHTAIPDTAPQTTSPRPTKPQYTKDAMPDATVPGVADLLRAMATRIERDPALVRSLLGGEMEPVTSNEDTSHAGVNKTPAEMVSPTTPGRKRSKRLTRSPEPTLDPFAALREHGEAGLRTQLGALDLEGLRAIVRAHRLDPARLASRWVDRERLAALIVEQVRARAALGRAFERV